MRISDWSSDVCSSDLIIVEFAGDFGFAPVASRRDGDGEQAIERRHRLARDLALAGEDIDHVIVQRVHGRGGRRRHPSSEEHTSELPSLMRISYAVFCLEREN